MHTPRLRPLMGSIPYVFLLAIATACGATDEQRPSSNANGKDGLEHANVDDSDDTNDDASDQGTDLGDGADASGGAANDPSSGTNDPDSSDVDTNPASDPNASQGSNVDAGNGANGQTAGGADSDGDGLPDSVETNTHRFVGKNNTGTDPNNWDTDGDGISDRDEVLGTAAGLNLPAMGTNPLRKNILLEYDWFDDANECAAHSHRPTSATASRVSDVFAASPVANPDGSTGITVIHDYGQGGLFTGGNRIDDADGVIEGGVSDGDYAAYRAKNFAANRDGYFHYVLLPHRYDTDSGSSGQAVIGGGDLIVSLYCANTDYNVASTIVHELGHNLGLRHGGDTDTNHKPNYNSVMNYDYQFKGIDTDCVPPGDHVIDYSRNQRITLDENNLDEGAGVCGNVWVDWNGNKSIDSNVAMDINQDKAGSVLTDYDDWAAIILDWHGRPSSLSKRNFATPEIATCDSRPPGY